MNSPDTPDDAADYPPWWQAEGTAAAVARVQHRLSSVGKGREATQEGRYRYRGIDDVINALHPLLAEAGVLIVPAGQRVLSEGPMPGRKDGWLRMVVEVTYEVRSAGADPGDVITVQGLGIGLDNADKATGKAVSYAYKTAISQLFSIPTDDPVMDPEHDAGLAGSLAWWGGWGTQQEHDAVIAELRAASQAVPEAFKALLRDGMRQASLLDSKGRLPARVTVEGAAEWRLLLGVVTHQAGTEPFLDTPQGAQDAATAPQPARGTPTPEAPPEATRGDPGATGGEPDGPDPVLGAWVAARNDLAAKLHALSLAELREEAAASQLDQAGSKTQVIGRLLDRLLPHPYGDRPLAAG